MEDGGSHEAQNQFARGLIHMESKIKVLAFLVILSVFSIAVSARFESDPVISSVLGITTFLFGIFVGFSMSDRRKRLDDIMKNDASERAALVFLYNMSKVYGNPVAEKVKHAIDHYLMATLDYRIWDYHKTEKYFDHMFEILLGLKPNNKRQYDVFDNILSIPGDIANHRKHTIALIGDRLSKFEWSVFLLFSGIIISSLLVINTGTSTSIAIVTVLSMAIVLLIVLLYKLDTLEWKKEARIFEPYQKTFEALGLMRYYPEELIRLGKVRNHKNRTYRLGVFPRPYPDLSGKKIKIVKGKR